MIKKILALSLIIFLLSVNPVFAANTKSIALDNSSLQYLSITDANQTGLDFSTAFTFMGWIKFDTLPIASGRAGFIY